MANESVSLRSFLSTMFLCGWVSAACSATSSVHETIIKDAASGRPLPGVLVAFVWHRRSAQPFHAAPLVCDRMQVVLTDTQGIARSNRVEGLGPPIVHAIHKPGFAVTGKRGTALLMGPTDESAEERLKRILRSAYGTTCSDTVLREGLPYLIQVRDEAARLASSASEMDQVDHLSAFISSLGGGTPSVIPQGVPR